LALDQLRRVQLVRQPRMSPVARAQPAFTVTVRGAICHWTLCQFLGGLSIIGVSMPCPEYLRLEQRYEAALRNWVQSMASSLTVQARQKALDDRKAAKILVCVHEESCSICRRKLAG
jgi:hypothetical protein